MAAGLVLTCVVAILLAADIFECDISKYVFSKMDYKCKLQDAITALF